MKRAFCVWQAKWHIIVHPRRLWTTGAMTEVTRFCVVLNNMSLEDRDGLSTMFQETRKRWAKWERITRI